MWLFIVPDLSTVSTIPFLKKKKKTPSQEINICTSRFREKRAPLIYVELQQCHTGCRAPVLWDSSHLLVLIFISMVFQVSSIHTWLVKKTRGALRAGKTGQDPAVGQVSKHMVHGHVPSSPERQLLCSGHGSPVRSLAKCQGRLGVGNLGAGQSVWASLTPSLFSG